MTRQRSCNNPFLEYFSLEGYICITLMTSRIELASSLIMVIISGMFSGFEYYQTLINDFKCCLCFWHGISSRAMLTEYNVIKRHVNSEAQFQMKNFILLTALFLFCETGINYIAMHGITRNRMWEAIASHVRHLTGFSALAPKKLSSRFHS